MNSSRSDRALLAAADPFQAQRSRRQRRTLRVVTGALLAVPAYLGVMAGAQQLGHRAWADQEYVEAQRWFALTEKIDLVERWVAPYNRGVVSFSEQKWLQSADFFSTARPLAPDHALCKVVLNESLALETLGDELTQVGDKAGARQRYTEAEKVLAEAEGCDSGEPEPEAEPEAEPEPESETESGGDQEAEPDTDPDTDPDADPDSESEPEPDSETDDAGEPSQGEEDSPEGSGSEMEQLGDAADRLARKISGAPGEGQAQEPTESPGEREAELRERGAGAARLRGELMDGTDPTPSTQVQRPTW